MDKLGTSGKFVPEKNKFHEYNFLQYNERFFSSLET